MTDKVEIILSKKEPLVKSNLWMRPYLDKEGYELLYYGAIGWTPLIPRCPIHQPLDNECNKLTSLCQEDYRGESGGILSEETTNCKCSNRN